MNVKSPKAILTVIILTGVLVITGEAQAASQDRVDKLSYYQLKQEGIKVVRNGGTYSVRWGDCSPYLKRIVQEIIERVFSPHKTEEWADYIVYRESGYCPGAVNTKYSNPDQQAQCVAQMIPAYHEWVDYKKCKSDPAYSVRVFERLSKGGYSTGPWS